MYRGTAPPAAPDIAYVIPTFRVSESRRDTHNLNGERTAERSGEGLTGVHEPWLVLLGHRRKTCAGGGNDSRPAGGAAECRLGMGREPASQLRTVARTAADGTSLGWRRANVRVAARRRNGRPSRSRGTVQRRAQVAVRRYRVSRTASVHAAGAPGRRALPGARDRELQALVDHSCGLRPTGTWPRSDDSQSR